jgi:hypothetical protein
MEQLFELLNLRKLLLNRNLILTYFVLEICVILLVLFILPLISSIFWIDLITNSIISFFCGVVELAVSFLFLFEFIRTKTFFFLFLVFIFLYSRYFRYIRFLRNGHKNFHLDKGHKCVQFFYFPLLRVPLNRQEVQC